MLVFTGTVKWSLMSTFDRGLSFLGNLSNSTNLTFNVLFRWGQFTFYSFTGETKLQLLFTWEFSCCLIGCFHCHRGSGRPGRHWRRNTHEDAPLQPQHQGSGWLSVFVLLLVLCNRRACGCSPAALTGGLGDSTTSRWMDLGRGFFFRLPERGLMTSFMSSISLSCFLLKYSFLM